MYGNEDAQLEENWVKPFCASKDAENESWIDGSSQLTDEEFLQCITDDNSKNGTSVTTVEEDVAALRVAVRRHVDAGDYELAVSEVRAVLISLRQGPENSRDVIRQIEQLQKKLVEMTDSPEGETLNAVNAREPQFVVACGTGEHGMTVAEIRAAASAGKLVPTDRIRKLDDNVWYELSTVKGLAFLGSGPSGQVADIPEALRYQVLKAASGKCVLCGASAETAVLHVDHIVPRSKGGTNDLDNLQCLCEQCNLGKSNKDTTDFRPE